MTERVRGLAPWRPQAKTRLLLVQVRRVLDEYEDQLPLTIRQVFYRLVGAYGYDKSETAYDRLQEMLNRARRAGVISFDDIRDDGTTVMARRSYDGVPDFLRRSAKRVKTYRRQRQDGQDRYIEIWVEAAGMVPQVYDVAVDYGVPVFSSSGFDSTTFKHDAAQRLLSRVRPTVVLHIGDYDPSGESLFDAVAGDVGQLVADLAGIEEVEAPHVWFSRLAVTPEQIDRYDLPTRPPKPSDKRAVFTDDRTTQAEALPPDALAEEVRQAVEAWYSLPVRDELIVEERSDRADLARIFADLLVAHDVDLDE